MTSTVRDSLLAFNIEGASALGPVQIWLGQPRAFPSWLRRWGACRRFITWQVKALHTAFWLPCDRRQSWDPSMTLFLASWPEHCVNFILGLMQADHDGTLMISGETCAKVDWAHSLLPSVFTANIHCWSLPVSLLWTCTLHTTDRTFHIHWSLVLSLTMSLIYFHLSMSLTFHLSIS